MSTMSATVIDPRPSTEAVSRILDIAEILFSEHGYAAVSMHAIAERAGVSKANIFHHFTSKRELYLAVVNKACRDAGQHLHELQTGGAFRERFAAFGKSVLHSMLEQERVHRLILRELLGESDDNLGKDMAEQVFGDKFARVVAILRGGQEAGELRNDFDPAMAAVALFGANMFFLHSRKVFAHFPDVTFGDDAERYARLLSDILFNGIAAPSQK